MDFAQAILPTIVASIILSALAWFIRAMVRGLKTYLDDEIRSKLVPNGGSSLADRMTSVEASVASMEESVEDLKKLYKESSCPNPDCPERYTCAHTQLAPRKPRFGLFG